MQRSDSRSPGKAAGGRQAVLTAGLLVPAAWWLSACGSGDDLMTSVALPSEQAIASAEGQPLSVAPEADLQSGKLDVTPAQQAYLDALSSAGVRPSSELSALSIGSSVCQARAAGQSDQAVWDFIAPQVRSDIADVRATTPQRAADVRANGMTADYIRIATEKLC